MWVTSVQCAVQYAVCSVQCAVCSFQCAVCRTAWCVIYSDCPAAGQTIPHSVQRPPQWNSFVRAQATPAPLPSRDRLWSAVHWETSFSVPGCPGHTGPAATTMGGRVWLIFNCGWGQAAALTPPIATPAPPPPAWTPTVYQGSLKLAIGMRLMVLLEICPYERWDQCYTVSAAAYSV